MASHRRTRPAVTRVADLGIPAPATAALAPVTLFAPAAEDSPAGDTGRPSREEIQRKIDDLYRRAESSTEQAVPPRTPTAGERPEGAERAERTEGGARAERAARRADMLTRAREMLGALTAAQNRTAPDAPEAAAELLAGTPQGYYDPAQVMSRLTARQRSLVQNHTAPANPAVPAAPRPVIPRQRQESVPVREVRGPQELREAPSAPRHDIRSAKAAVQHKLATARELLSRAAAPLPPPPSVAPAAPAAKTAQAATAAPVAQTAPLAPLAPAAAAPLAPLAPAAPVAQTAPLAPAAPVAQTAPLAPAAPAAPVAPVAPDASYAPKAAKALAFARAQIGKPYVWGAAGPGSYDCSGLTQAAWKAAGVTLPRSIPGQAGAGRTVPLSEAVPGDLVLFRNEEHDGIGHIGVYAGDGMMIHAPRPGGYVCEEPIHRAGGPAVEGVVRPA
ncbi:C40 family peptidase [Streptomyces anandii]|uniref:C40 family peptidase n=1 Tax=Streptomyces anandii TaxID=285454 RepID=UPI0036F7A5A8